MHHVNTMILLELRVNVSFTKILSIMIPSLSSLWYSDIYHGTEIHILWLLYGKCPKYHASTIISMDTITFTKKKILFHSEIEKKNRHFCGIF